MDITCQYKTGNNLKPDMRHTVTRLRLVLQTTGSMSALRALLCYQETLAWRDRRRILFNWLKTAAISEANVDLEVSKRSGY